MEDIDGNERLPQVDEKHSLKPTCGFFFHFICAFHPRKTPLFTDKDYNTDVYIGKNN